MEDVLNQNPREAAAKNNLGNIYHLQQKYEIAAIMYLEALELE